jgi:hypothetical protein
VLQSTHPLNQLDLKSGHVHHLCESENKNKITFWREYETSIKNKIRNNNKERERTENCIKINENVKKNSSDAVSE